MSNVYKSQSKYLKKNNYLFFVLPVFIFLSYLLARYTTLNSDVVVLAIILSFIILNRLKSKYIYDRADIDDASILLRKNTSKEHDTSFRMLFKDIVVINVKNIKVNDYLGKQNCKAYVFRHSHGEDQFLRYDIFNRNKFEDTLVNAGIDFPDKISEQSVQQAHATTSHIMRNGSSEQVKVHLKNRILLIMASCIVIGLLIASELMKKEGIPTWARLSGCLIALFIVGFEMLKIIRKVDSA